MNNAPLVSKFRTAYWVRQFLQYFGGLFLIGLFFVFSTNSRRFDYKNGLFWIACFCLVFFLFDLLKFLFTELKRLAITKNEIIITYLLTGRVDVIQYTNIRKFSTKHITMWVGIMRSDGWSELEIELADGRLLIFDEDQFENYLDIKNEIYRHKQVEK